jgi:nucleoside-diphosphate-sugar epimerase
MKILVAGGSGFIGSVLTPLLLEHGYDVDVADLCWFGDHVPMGAKLLRKNLFEFKETDLKGYDRVVFLAGLSNDPMAEFDPAMNFVHNGALPSYLAFMAKKAGVPRFVYASSCSVYGYTENKLYDEESPVMCGYPYGISKLQGEHGSMQLQDGAFSVIALRQGTVCGYSPRMRFDLIVNTMFKTAMLDGRVVIDNPAIWRPLIDVRDTAEAFLLAVGADDAISGVFNVAYDNFTVGDVAEMVREAMQRLSGKKIDMTVNNRMDFRNYRVSFDKARECLGFAPRHNVPDMVESLFAHLAEYGDLSKDVFYNIRVFTKLEHALI